MNHQPLVTQLCLGLFQELGRISLLGQLASRSLSSQISSPLLNLILQFAFWRSSLDVCLAGLSKSRWELSMRQTQASQVQTPKQSQLSMSTKEAKPKCHWSEQRSSTRSKMTAGMLGRRKKSGTAKAALYPFLCSCNTHRIHGYTFQAVGKTSSESENSCFGPLLSATRLQGTNKALFA